MHSWHDELPSRSYPVFGNQSVSLLASCARSTRTQPFSSCSDVAPVNGFPRSTTVNASEADWVFELAARDWEKWIGQDAAQQVRMMSGCYATVHPGTDLKIISLNTNYWCVPGCLPSLARLAQRD